MQVAPFYESNTDIIHYNELVTYTSSYAVIMRGSMVQGLFGLQLYFQKYYGEKCTYHAMDER